MNVCENSILVYQNGKVGSSTVSKSLQKAGVKNAHVHRLFFKNDVVGELILGEEQGGFIRTSNFFNYQFSEYVVDIKKKNKCKKIITMVREPISVDLSTVFQWIGAGTTNRYFTKQISKGKSFRQVVFDLMVKIQDRQYRWFDEELKELCGIDVYSHSFDKKMGYTIISENGFEVLLIKAEKLSSLVDVIRDFVDEQQFELVNENVGKDKDYAHLYEEIKVKVELTKEYVEHYYKNNPNTDYFYSKEEQERFLDKWKKNIKI